MDHTENGGQHQHNYQDEFDNPYAGQGDEESQKQQQQQQQQQTSRPAGWLFGGIDFVVLRKLPTMMMLVNIGLLFLTVIIMTSWRGATDYWVLLVDAYSFFIATLLIPFFVLIIFVAILLFQFDKHLPNVNFPFAFLINCVLWAFFLVISSSVVFGNANRYNCDQWHCSHLVAVGIFGFLCAIGLLVQALLHFFEIRGGR